MLPEEHRHVNSKARTSWGSSSPWDIVLERHCLRRGIPKVRVFDSLGWNKGNRVNRRRHGDLRMSEVIAMAAALRISVRTFAAEYEIEMRRAFSADDLQKKARQGRSARRLKR